MKAVIQRVTMAEVVVDGESVASIKNGLLVLVGFSKKDVEAKLEKAAKKIVELRIFEDENGKMNLSVKDMGYEILVVPNFTLEGEIEKGRRPSFDNCMEPEKAKKFYDMFCELIEKQRIPVKRGVFQARMEVKLTNCGPVTFVLSV
ncbi:MAG: D-aminoacyl-tRNA deacylase [candidate division WOR-3 bacterium]